MADKNGFFEKKLSESGLRSTRARLLILHALSRKNVHMTTEELLEYLRDNGDKSSIATIYQNLKTLVENGLLNRISSLDGIMRFDANLEPHQHLICIECGCIIDVSVIDNTIDKLNPTDFHTGKKLKEWNISGVQIEFRGQCRKCNHKST